MLGKHSALPWCITPLSHFFILRGGRLLLTTRSSFTHSLYPLYRPSQFELPRLAGATLPLEALSGGGGGTVRLSDGASLRVVPAVGDVGTGGLRVAVVRIREDVDEGDGDDAVETALLSAVPALTLSISCASGGGAAAAFAGGAVAPVVLAARTPVAQLPAAVLSYRQRPSGGSGLAHALVGAAAAGGAGAEAPPAKKRRRKVRVVEDA